MTRDEKIGILLINKGLNEIELNKLYAKNGEFRDKIIALCKFKVGDKVKYKEEFGIVRSVKFLENPFAPNLKNKFFIEISKIKKDGTESQRFLAYSAPEDLVIKSLP